MPERLVLVLSDIVDSTALNATLGDDAMGRLWADHDRVGRALIRSHGGREIGRTDGFLAVFGDVDAAVGFAVAFHRALDDLRPALRARVGVHVGTISLRENAAEDIAAGATRFDVDGIALPLAARISAIARGRQTLLSRDALEDLHLPSHLRTRSHGLWQFKGMAEPIEVAEVGDDRSDFVPPEDGDKGYRVVATADSWRPAREIRHSIPPDRDAFIGRGADLQRLSQLLEDGARLLTLVGIGGVGKTRLAKHFARRWLGDYDGGCWFCDLADTRETTALGAAVAQGLDVQLGRADPVERLADAMITRGRCLIVLDNCEQVLRPLGDALTRWLDRAPQATFIATSRERLGVPGERVCEIDALAAPDANGLFRARAAAAAPRLHLGLEDEPAIGDLVGLLDRLPLAIELAAGRAGVMSPGSMLRRLDTRFSLLAARGGARPKRQSTLRATLDWSWELLGFDEQCVLSQASIFVGGFDLEAAEAVLRTVQVQGPNAVLDVLQSLVEKSLVRCHDDRFSLLISVREYAGEMLHAVDAAARGRGLAEAEQRHGEHYAARAKGPAADLENVIAAARRAIARRDAPLVGRACTTAWRWLETRGPLKTSMQIVDAALSVPGLAASESVALQHLRGRNLLVAGELAAAREQFELALEAGRRLGVRHEEMRALCSLAELNAVSGRLDEARLQYETALDLADGLDAPASRCAALNGLGVYYNRQGQFSIAREHFERALTVARGAGELRWEGGALSNLGLVEANLGNRVAAKRFYDDAIAVAQALGDRTWEGNLLCNLGLFHLEGGDNEAARSDLARSLLLAREGGLSLLESVVLCNMGLLGEADSDDTAAERAYREALAVAQRRGDSRSQGQFLGYLGLVVARRGDVASGLDLLAQSVEILRRVRDRLSLAVTQSRRAQALAWSGDGEAAQAALDEAAALAQEIGVAPGSELATALEAARGAMADAAVKGA